MGISHVGFMAKRSANYLQHAILISRDMSITYDYNMLNIRAGHVTVSLQNFPILTDKN
jgi:hypothetical protein